MSKLRLRKKIWLKTFNKHYIDIVEIFSGVKPYNVALEKNVS